MVLVSQNLCFDTWSGSVGNNSLINTQMCIVTGPRIDLAITLIDRMKGGYLQIWDLLLLIAKNYYRELNGLHIEAYPSHHSDAMRGLERCRIYIP